MSEAPGATSGMSEVESAATAFLSDPATYRVSTPVETIATHISRIFLVGDRAYKMKRAVKLPYADFSTPDLRLAACLKELDLNRATAPELYLAVRRVTREADGHLAFDGAGALVDAVVEMARFDQAALLDRMAGQGQLTVALMTATAAAIARFHATAPVIHSGGGAANIAGVLAINEAGFRTSHVFSEAEQARLSEAFRTALATHAAELDARERHGTVRRCHGDLHLRNIFVADGAPRLFDCIEFNDQLATVDVLYDLAFLLMDLIHRGYADFANLVANRYLDVTDDEADIRLLPFFTALRGAVRAHVTATAADMYGSTESRAEARAYFELALRGLEPARPRLIAIGGYSGSGKTTIAEALGPRIGPSPGARLLESDRLRKAMYGVSAETRLDPSGYRPEVSDKVYAELARRSEAILTRGGTVIANAVYDRVENRAHIADAAQAAGVDFTGIWLAVDPAILRQRVAARSGGPSDATVDVLARQLAQGTVPDDWISIDASQPVDEIIMEILSVLAAP